MVEECNVCIDLCSVEGDLTTAYYVRLGVDEDGTDDDDCCKSEGELKLVHDVCIRLDFVTLNGC